MTAAEPSGVVVLLLWLVLIAVAVPLLVADVRLRYFSGLCSTGSRKSYRRFPPPSATPSTPAPSGGMASCSAAARIGDTLLGYPKARLTNEEQAFLDGPTETLCALASEWDIAQRMDLPPAAWDYIKAEGFFALIIQGIWRQGLLAYAHSQIVMKLATRSGDLASTVMVPNSLGPAELLMHYGTEEQPTTTCHAGQRHRHPLLRPHRPYAGSDARRHEQRRDLPRQWRGECSACA